MWQHRCVSAQDAHEREEQPHQARRIAESFGADPRRYHRARPSYPAQLVEAIIAAMPGRAVLDVGRGTGISSRLFQERGCAVLGVEVDGRMAGFARERGLDVEVSAFEGWDPAGRIFDAVVSGQRWHWIDPVGGAAKAAAALGPGGRLAAFWNVFAPPPQLADAFAEVHRRVVPHMPRNPWVAPALDAYSTILERTAHGIRATGAFGEPEQWRFDWERPYTRDEWLDQNATGGDALQLAPGELQALLDGLGAVIDDAGGTLTMGYAAVVLTAARRRPRRP
jgi:SAM-dependent methyltransferase